MARGYGQSASKIKGISRGFGQAMAKIKTTRTYAQAQARTTKGTYGLWINKLDRTTYIKNQTITFRLNSLDVTLIDPPSIPNLGDNVTFDVPYWSGNVTSVKTTDNDITGHKWVKVTATNSNDAVIVSTSVALVDTNNQFRNLSITKTLNEGVTETRGNLETFVSGIYPGMNILLTAATHGYAAQAFSVTDVEIGFLKPSTPIYNVSFGDEIVTMSAWLNSGSNDVFPIDSTKITDGSVTTPKLASNAVTTDKLDANVVVANVANVGDTVVIDSTGITINDGALTLNDEFGSTAMTAEGFTGSWGDYIGLGLYNGRMTHGIAGTIGSGRTSALPFWTVSNDVGTPTLTFLDPGVSLTFSNLGDQKRLVSDSVAVQGNIDYEFGCITQLNSGAGLGVGVTLSMWVEWFDENGYSLGSTTVTTAGATNGSGSSSPSAVVGVDTAPDSAFFAQLILTGVEIGGHSASNRILLYGGILKEVPLKFNTLTINNSLSLATTANPPTTSMVIGGSLVSFGTYRQGGVSTAFPTSPTTNDTFFRTDHKMWFYYDGTRWLSTNLFHLPVQPNPELTFPLAATGLGHRGGTPVSTNHGTDIYLTEYWCSFFVNGGTALGASHNWSGAFRIQPSVTAVGTITINSGSSSVWRQTSAVTLNQLLGSDFQFEIQWTKTGTPGSLYAFPIIAYRIVAT